MMKASEVWALDHKVQELEKLAVKREKSLLQVEMARRYRRCPEKYLSSNFEMAKAILRGDLKLN